MRTVTTANVDLSLPLDKEYAKVLRLATAGIASRLDFSWEQIEDIKLAVEEVFLLVMQGAKDKSSHFNFLVTVDGLMINVLNAYLGSFDIHTYEQKYSFFILTGLMDKVDMIPRDKDYFDIQLIKKLH